MKRIQVLGRRYGWAAILMLVGVGLFTGQEQMPPGTDLVGALIALFGVGHQISSNVAERIFERIGAIALKQTELAKVADDHAAHIDKHQTYLKSLGCPQAKVLRPVG
jgi:hypothetical protein